MFAMVCIFVIATTAFAAKPKGLLAEWNFDEGKGTVAKDSSGNGHDATLYGATWAKQGDGFALNMDGFDDYVDCGKSSSIGIGGPITIEAWVKPTRKAHGESCLFGEGYGSYLMTYYDTEVCHWYISGGDNGRYGALLFNEWNHVAGTFDGNDLCIWINGRMTSSRKSKYPSYEPDGNFKIGIKGRPDLPKFKGLVDRVRVYNRGISGEDVKAHFKAEKSEYSDPTKSRRIKITAYQYLANKEIVVEADYKDVLPLEGTGRVEVTLASKENPGKIIMQQKKDRVPTRTSVVEVKLRCSNLAAGDYIIRLKLEDEHGAYPVEECTISHPLKTKPLASPAQKMAAPLPPKQKPTKFDYKIGKGGGFELNINGVSYPFVSRISWPNGKFNYLTPTATPYSKGEQFWNVDVRTVKKGKFEVNAAGKFYAIKRDIEVFPTHVYVKDKYTNITKNDLGLLIYNETPLKPEQVIKSLLSGYERRGRQAERTVPDYCPSVFFTDANTGMGMLPIDDVFVVQSVSYIDWEGAAGVGTEKFALAPGASYTLEWAVYPTGSGDYYDFINNVRTVETRISTVEGAPGIIGRRSVPDPIMIDRLKMKIAIIPCIFNALDDPKLHIEGIEFMDFPKEMQFLKKTNEAIHKTFPDLKVVIHIAHSLYTTDNPDRFKDSQVIAANGKQASWGDGSDFGEERKAANWKWWIFYPTPGNSFHDAMMKSVDVMMDEMDMDGGFMDGFFAGYQGQWTYDGRWDGHSADIDANTKTIKRKVGSVLLLSQPSMIEYARKIRDKGGVVLANNSVFTRTIANEKYIIFNCECASGPQQHLAPNVIALAQAWGPALNSEKDTYLDMLDKLSWGELWFSYGEPWERFPDPTALTLAAKQFPMTFAEIRSGLVKGPERIVTMNSGVYGWHGDRKLHAVYKFDGRGKPVANDFITTIDKESVRTEIKLKTNESTVIEPIPATIEASTPVNVQVLQHDDTALKMFINGQGEAALKMSVDVAKGAAYRISIGRATTTIAEKNGTLIVPLKLDGEVEVVIKRANNGK